MKASCKKLLFLAVMAFITLNVGSVCVANNNAINFDSLVNSTYKYKKTQETIQRNSLKKSNYYFALDNYNVISNKTEDEDEYYNSFSGFSCVEWENLTQFISPNILLSFPLDLWNLKKHKIYLGNCFQSEYNNFAFNNEDSKNLLYTDFLNNVNGKNDESDFNTIIASDSINVYIILSSTDHLNNEEQTTNKTYISVMSYHDYCNNKDNVISNLSSIYKNINNFDPTNKKNTYTNILQNSILEFSIDNLLSIESNVVSSFQNKKYNSDLQLDINHNYTFHSKSNKFSSQILCLHNSTPNPNNIFNYNMININSDYQKNIIDGDYTLSLSPLNYYNFADGNPLNFSLDKSVNKIYFSIFSLLIGILLIVSVTFSIIFIYYIKNRWVLDYIDAN